MRKPASQDGGVWVHEPTAARYLDLANALYALMLRFLVQVYSMENRDPVARKTILEAAFSLMHGVAAIAALLTNFLQVANFQEALREYILLWTRYFTPLELASEKLLLVERLDEILDEVRTLQNEMEDQAIPERKL